MDPRLLVCVVDDDLHIRKALKRLIESAGYSVKAFASAYEFLDSDDTKDRILILDVNMPEMSGFDLQKKLVAEGADIPIIFITAYEYGKEKSDAMDASAVAFLEKPFDAQDLLGAIDLAVAMLK